MGATMRMDATTLGIVLLLTACGTATTKLDKAPAGSELSFKSMSIVEYDKGEVVYRARAKSAAGDRDHLTMKDVSVVHRGWPQTGTVNATAATATAELQSGSLSLDGAIFIVDSFSRKVRTEHIDYDGANKKVRVPGAISIESAEVTAQAKGLDGDLASEEMHVIGPVDGTFVAP